MGIGRSTATRQSNGERSRRCFDETASSVSDTLWPAQSTCGGARCRLLERRREQSMTLREG
ncbi:hypothetical protein C488_04417 [Natrinema pellirubrum DSM 15624]|uniref:Uncharacterized protein n=1 Tax=Natrinema pellirubrum (strain DSM 15624 / CIP 106293 / JCM 10476 / NCIMB 786 / 157) TaxID=797303 RepID=L9Z0Y5_NATP1|nr:hypothetical protein C488_04417 [Natrinema pellirubrum DSM 15624]